MLPNNQYPIPQREPLIRIIRNRRIHRSMSDPIYNVYEANVTDEDAYKNALPEVQKIIKENGGVYVAGGFNKAKTDLGKPEAGNRFVIIRYDSEAPSTSSGTAVARRGSKSMRLKLVA